MDEMLKFFTDPEVAGAVALLGLAGTVVAVYLAWRANSFAKKCAHAQKVFQEGEVELCLFEHRDVDSIVIAGPLLKEAILTTSLAIQVKNTGTIPLQQAQVVVRANKDLSYGDALDKKQYPQVHPYGDCHVMDDENMRSLLFNIKQPFYAKLGITFQIPITLRKDTRVVASGTVRSKDNVPFNYSVAARYAWTIDVMVLSVTEKPFTKRIYLYVVDTTSEDPLKAIADITSKDVKLSSKPGTVHPFLFAEIKKDEIKKESYPYVYSGNIPSGSIKLGFFDSEGGQIVGTESPKNPLRHPAEKFLWAKSHGYVLKNKNGRT